MSETTLKRRVVSFLDSIPNLEHFPYFSGGFGKAGVSDRIICYKGRFIGLELKDEKGISSELQLKFKDRIEKAGGIALIIRPSTFDLLKKVIMEA